MAAALSKGVAVSPEVVTSFIPHFFFFLLGIDEWHSCPCSPLPSPPDPALHQGVTAGKLQPQVNQISVQQGCLTTLAVQDQHRGAEKQGRVPSRHEHHPAHDFSKALQRCRLGLDFPLGFVVFFF